jgi:WD40 repeat protein
LISSCGTRIWDSKSNSIVSTLSMDQICLSSQFLEKSMIVFYQDGTIAVWDEFQKKPLDVYLHDSPVMAYSKGVFGDENGKVYKFTHSIQNPKCIRQMSCGINGIDVDGENIVVIGDDGGVIVIQ